MELSKLEITPLDKDGKRMEGKRFKVLFNPNTYSVSKSVTWSTPQSKASNRPQTDRKLNAPTLTYGGGANRQLSLELFYDVTESEDVSDVRRETNKIANLTVKDRDLKRPPAVEISWGTVSPEGSDFPFTGVVSSLTQRFTLFTSDGRPVRATLSVVFTEFLDPGLDQRKTDPEFTTRFVRASETLSSIAADVYHDPTLWRVIAEANEIDDPRRLTVGQILSIPKVG
jgi:nucleoid-associated protein YgaU